MRYSFITSWSLFLLGATGALGCRYAPIAVDADQGDAAAARPGNDAALDQDGGHDGGPDSGAGAPGQPLALIDGGAGAPGQPLGIIDGGMWPGAAVVDDDAAVADEDVTVIVEDDDAGPSTCVTALQAGCTPISGWLFGDGVALAGATFRVTHEQGIYSTISASDGSYGLIVPEGLVLITISAPGFWDTEGYGTVAAAAEPGGVINLYSPAWMQNFAGGLGRTQDPSKGWVFALLGGVSGNGGEGVTLGLGSDAPFTHDASGSPVVSDHLVPSGSPTLHFSNVELGVLDPEPFAPAGWTCAPLHPGVANVVRPNTYSMLLVECGPSGP